MVAILCSIITLLYYAIISYCHHFVMFRQLYSMQLMPAWPIAPSNADCAPQ